MPESGCAEEKKGERKRERGGEERYGRREREKKEEERERDSRKMRN